MLESKGYAPVVRIMDDRFLLVDVEKSISDDFIAGLGGVDRIGELIESFDHVPSVDEVLSVLSPLPKKWKLGVSFVGVDGNSRKFSMDMKKGARALDSRLSFVLPGGKDSALNSAQVMFNQLDEKPNSELTILRRENRYYLVRTAQIQDIQRYELRDTKRPARDAQVGMLPPKLAQIMLNICVSEMKKDSYSILDPFCGTGVVVQEGLLLGYDMVGSDTSTRMIEYSTANMEWLERHFAIDAEFELSQHNVKDPFPASWKSKVHAIVSEPFLGEPLHSPLPQNVFDSRCRELKELYLSFFQHAHDILESGDVILFLLPAVKLHGMQDGVFELFPHSLFDDISKIGYRVKHLIPEALSQEYTGTDRGTITYARPDALVSRELTLWEKI